MSLSKFVQNSAPAGDSLEEKIMIDIYLAVLGRRLAEAISNPENSIGRSPALFHQFKNVILRHTDQKKWKLFLEGVAKRKGSLDGLEKVQKWLAEEGDNPVDECLEAAKADIESIYYSLEDQTKRRHNPTRIIPTGEWTRVAADIEDKVRNAVMRECLLRIIERALQ